MFPPQHFTGQGLSSPGAPCVPPAPPGNIPVIFPTTSASTPYGQIPGAAGRPPISLPTIPFQPVVESRRTDVARIGDLPPLPEIRYDEYDAEYASDDLSDLGGANGKAPISLKQMEFSLKQFAKRMGQPKLQYFQQVEDSMGGWVSGEEASVPYPGTEAFETAARWTPAPGDGSIKFLGDCGDLAAFGKF